MPQLTRILFAIFMLAGLSTVGAVADTQAFKFKWPSASGSFLAGQEALRDMRTESASQYFLDAAEADWENPIVVERAFTALAANGKVEDAAALGQHLLDIDPGNEMAHLLLATVAIKERRYAAAANQLRNLGVDSFVGITATLLEGWALVAEGDYGQSQKALDELGRAGLEDFLVFHRALMADVAGQKSAALSFGKRAYETDPNLVRIVEAYIRMLGNDGQYDAAKQVIADFEAEGATHPVIKQLALAIDKGVRPGKLVTTAQSGAAEMYHGIGSVLARDGVTEIAVVFLRLGAYLDPSNEVILLALAEVYDQLGLHEVANTLYEALPNNSPLKPLAVVRVAQNIDTMGDREEAMRRLGNIVATQPDNLDAVQVLGDLSRYNGEFDKAAEYYSKVIELAGGEHPNDWQYYFVRGIAYEQAGKWDLAEADLIKALKLNPRQPSVLNYLGYSWVDKGMNLARALDMIRQAVNMSPGNGYIVDSLGWAYYKLDRLPEAVATMEQAVQLLPSDAEVNDHLGDVYWAVGRKAEARFQWNVAVTVDKGGKVAKRAQPKLDNGLDGLSTQ